MTETLSERIKAARRAAGLTQQTLAVRAGMSMRGVSELEQGGRTDPHYSTLLKLAEALDVNPHWLYTGVSPQSMLRELLESVGAKTQHLAKDREELVHACEGFSSDEVLAFYNEVLAEKQLIGPILDRRYDSTASGADVERLNTLWLEQFTSGLIAIDAAQRRIEEIETTTLSKKQAEALRRESEARARDIRATAGPFTAAYNAL